MDTVYVKAFLLLLLLLVSCRNRAIPDETMKTRQEVFLATRGLSFQSGTTQVTLDSVWRTQSPSTNDVVHVRLHVSNTSSQPQSVTPGSLEARFDSTAVTFHGSGDSFLIPLEDAHQSDFSFEIPRKLKAQLTWRPNSETAVLLDSMLASHEQSFAEFIAYFKRALADHDTTFLNAVIPSLITLSHRKDDVEDYMLSDELPAPRQRVIAWLQPHGQGYEVYVDSVAMKLDVYAEEGGTRLYFRRHGNGFVVSDAKVYQPLAE